VEGLPRTAGVVAGAVCGALTLSACFGGASATSAEPCAVGSATRAAVAPVNAATPEALLSAVLRQIGRSGLRDARVTVPPAGFSGKAWLTFSLPAGRREAAEAHWAALLAAAAYRDQADRNGLKPVAGTSFPPTGGSVLGGGHGSRPISSYATLSATSLECLVRRNARRLHTRVVSMRMLRVEGLPVPVVTVRVPAALARRSGGNWGLALSMLDSPAAPPPYLGALVTVEDANGRWVQSLGQVPSTGTGAGDVSPRYQSGQSCAGLPDCSAHG
jgi:hypothetical protein